MQHSKWYLIHVHDNLLELVNTVAHTSQFNLLLCNKWEKRQREGWMTFASF